MGAEPRTPRRDAAEDAEGKVGTVSLAMGPRGPEYEMQNNRAQFGIRVRGTLTTETDNTSEARSSYL